MLIVACSLVGFAGCDDDDTFEFPEDDSNGGGNTTTGGVDIDVTAANPSTGDTNISGSAVTVQSSSDTLNSVAVTRVQVDATTGGYKRQVLVYFDAGGTAQAVSYNWGVASALENSVYCTAAGCAGVTVNLGTREISFFNTALDDHGPGSTGKVATLSLGIIAYPAP
jgi:hypothetical protein